MGVPLCISEKAIAMIVGFEVTSEAVYEAKYEKPTWPGGSSGVTVGIGYDVGYVSAQDLAQDWQGEIADAMIAALRTAVGVKGSPAKPLAHALGASVLVSWAAANEVFRTRSIPPLVARVGRALQNCGLLSGDSLGALVSLAYNRGVSFDATDDRHREMRAIKSHMAEKQFGLIPAEFRSMKRLWPDTPGLVERREEEAQLFEQGLLTVA